jgi:hypothetical protein
LSISDCQLPVDCVLPTAIKNWQCYLVSLCDVCLRQRRQNLLNSKRSVVVFLFFVVT